MIIYSFWLSNTLFEQRELHGRVLFVSIDLTFYFCSFDASGCLQLENLHAIRRGFFSLLKSYLWYVGTTIKDICDLQPARGELRQKLGPAKGFFLYWLQFLGHVCVRGAANVLDSLISHAACSLGKKKNVDLKLLRNQV